MSSTNHPVDTYAVRNVPLTRPFIWLSEGWADLMHHRAASLAYGVLVALLGVLIFAYSRHPFYLAAVSAAFLLVGPILTAGCCELSRLQDAAQAAGFEDSLRPLSRNRQALLGVAQTLALLALAWFALSAGLYFGLVGSPAPSLASTVGGDVLRQLSANQLFAYGVVGLVLAGAVFTLSVVTVPMIVDRHVDAATAMRMSLRVTLRDLPVMLVWALLIALLVAAGFATGLIGMIVIFPLLAHATWRAYTELVEH
ncbi:MAG: hypothetical protein CME59_22375 [Halioglobus sp.]|nr:hypothetical protein [Halioglobus sp.]|tara:strand:- start:242 stop:1003 length:762 start_codon:yes stop_codon:yes gene_type:complete